ncbi:MAG: DNA replication and repair protein RecF [Patescibacteria group bacterium]
MPEIATTIRLSGFRRFHDYTVSLSSPTVIVGPNGVGKTTLLEALYYTSLGRSYRTSSDRDMIGWQTDTARIEATFSTGLSITRAISTFRGSVTKQCQVNGLQTTPLASLGQLHVVLFAPELIELIMGAPRVRRRYLDILLSGTDPEYAQALLRYQHALKQRNALLLQPPQVTNSFDVWESLLVDTGTLLLRKRERLVRLLQTQVQPAYDALEPATKQRTVQLSYESSVEPQDRYSELLVASRERDRRSTGTSLGPHRDELRIQLDAHPVSFASRGEQRSLLLALKQAELALHATTNSELPPYLLLDDLFSELDKRRSTQLTQLLAQYPTIVTTTDATSLDPSLREAATILDLTDHAA